MLSGPIGVAGWILTTLGVGLLTFAALLVWLLSVPRRLTNGARFVLLADVAWLLGAVVLLAGFPRLLAPMLGDRSAGTLHRLHREFGDEVRFVLVQVREAHPGEHLDQPASPEDKRAHAKRLRETLGIDLTVAVDDPDGRFHASLDPKPNAAYLVAAGGQIVFRSMWAGDERGLSEALRATANGATPEHEQSTRMTGPMLRAIGYVDQVLRDAGPRAARDLARCAPPMLLGARMASLFRGLAPQRRGTALVASSAAVVALVVTLVLR